MKISVFFLILFLNTAQADWKPEPELECGVYHVSGKFFQNRTHFILSSRHGSKAPLELIILGGSISEKIKLVGKTVALKVYVPKDIKSNLAPFVFLQEVLKPVRVEKPWELIRTEECGREDRFSVIN